jgi:hypothetical protein
VRAQRGAASAASAPRPPSTSASPDHAADRLGQDGGRHG